MRGFRSRGEMNTFVVKMAGTLAETEMHMSGVIFSRGNSRILFASSKETLLYLEIDNRSCLNEKFSLFMR